MLRIITNSISLFCMLVVASLRCFAGPAVDPSELGRPTFRTFTDRDGLPQSSINSMVYDRKGYLWVGTKYGAARYNGRTWTVVNMPNRAGSNWITSILAASD